MRFAMLGMLLLGSACSGGGRSDDGEPISPVRVAFSPADLTTNAAADEAVYVFLTNAGPTPIQTDGLAAAVQVTSADGTEIPGLATVSPESDTFITRVRFDHDAPLAEGWFRVAFATAALSDVDAFVRDERAAAEPTDGVFVTRFRVGSQPFLRGATVCGGGGERATSVALEFSEPVSDSTGGAARVFLEDGSLACMVSIPEPIAEARVDCPTVDPTRPFTIELPGLVGTEGVVLQRGPDGGPPPDQYTVRPTGGFEASRSCLWYLLVPADSLSSVTAS